MFSEPPYRTTRHTSCLKTCRRVIVRFSILYWTQEHTSNTFCLSLRRTMYKRIWGGRGPSNLPLEYLNCIARAVLTADNTRGSANICAQGVSRADTAFTALGRGQATSAGAAHAAALSALGHTADVLGLDASDTAFAERFICARIYTPLFRQEGARKTPSRERRPEASGKVKWCVGWAQF